MQHPGADGRRRSGPVRLVVVRQPVLEHGRGTPVPGVVAAQAVRVRRGDGRGQLRVLGVALLVTAPQRVAQQIDRRRPDVEADPVVAGAHRPGLLGDRLADPPHQLRVPGRAQAHRLREHRRRAHPGHAVQGLLAGPPGGDAEPLHGGRELVQEGDLLVQGEPRQQIVDALRERQVRIAERRRGRRVNGHEWFPLRMERRDAFEALRCSFDRGRVSRCCARTGPTFRRLGKAPTLAHRAAGGPRNLGNDPCAPPGVHLTSQQHRSASIARFRSRASAQPIH